MGQVYAFHNIFEMVAKGTGIAPGSFGNNVNYLQYVPTNPDRFVEMPSEMTTLFRVVIRV